MIELALEEEELIEEAEELEELIEDTELSELLEELEDELCEDETLDAEELEELIELCEELDRSSIAYTAKTLSEDFGPGNWLDPVLNVIN